ncbi:LacI family DNA-binding transcriptional regulator [Micromonospora chersina]|uniref:LacI family DNA-binding transcriptional regulator n=1 Tax=Micromonospora chersina TaxID=47854 RepID=UPI001BB30E6C
MAQHANVSSGTVSRVLNQRANVAPDLRERVIRSAELLGYQPSGIARHGGGAGPVQSIGFLLTLPYLGPVPELMAPFWAAVLQGAETEAGRRGARLTYSSFPGQGVAPAQVLTRVGELGLDATLLVGDPSPEVVDALERLTIPVVLVDTQLEHGRHDAVLPDYAEGSRLVVDELIAAGHRDIAFIGGPLVPGSRVHNQIPAIEARARGLRDSLAYAGIPFRPELVETCDLTQAGGAAAAARLLAGADRFTAIFCANDATASGAVQALRDAGRQVPTDVSVVGAGDELGAHIFPPLTTFRFDVTDLGATAVRRLFQRAEDASAGTATLLLPVDLVRRSSVATAPA